jgi:hypothetical protein
MGIERDVNDFLDDFRDRLRDLLLDNYERGRDDGVMECNGNEDDAYNQGYAAGAQAAREDLEEDE